MEICSVLVLVHTGAVMTLYCSDQVYTVKCLKSEFIKTFATFCTTFFKIVGIRPLAPVQNSVSLKLMQRKTLNFVIKLPDVENITK